MQVTGSRLQDTSFRLHVVGYELQVAGMWCAGSPVAVCWLWVACFWVLWCKVRIKEFVDTEIRMED